MFCENMNCPKLGTCLIKSIYGEKERKDCYHHIIKKEDGAAEFAMLIMAHYPHTSSIQSTIKKELKKYTNGRIEFNDDGSIHIRNNHKIL